jgi:hypothetical protein
MIFTQHALDKLDVYGISPEWVDELTESPIHDFRDVIEGSRIVVVKSQEILLAIVVEPDGERVITVYRTDVRTIENRRKAGRWV